MTESAAKTPIDTRLAARFGDLDLEIRRREVPGETEVIMVSIRATPSFAALIEGYERSLPMAFAPLATLATLPLQAMGTMWLLWSMPLQLFLPSTLRR